MTALIQLAWITLIVVLAFGGFWLLGRETLKAWRQWRPSA